jgi:hypothetical protein
MLQEKSQALQRANEGRKSFLYFLWTILDYLDLDPLPPFELKTDPIRILIRNSETGFQEVKKFGNSFRFGTTLS